MTSRKDSTGRSTADIQHLIESARNRLLDLSLRNRLINFRPSARRSLKIVDKDLARIYQELVLEERTLSFKAATKSMLEEPIAVSEPEDEPADEAHDEALANGSRRAKASLQTMLESDTLPRKLFRIANEANSVFEEQGYTVLYLALGFLEWEDSASSEQLRKAPLILVPVELERTKVRESYRLIWTKEDIGTNLSLLERLLEMGVALPEFNMPEDSSGIDEYLEKVRRAIAKRSDWQVTNEIYVGFFSFTKFVMYKDLDPAEWPAGRTPAEHPLIRALFAPQPGQVGERIFDENEIDDTIDWKAANQVMDADPSQIVAIESIKAGRNLVVEGPPGTGKSQTIANVIAELLAMGKSVLFVSEKMAALEVVKQRLDSVGLGDFCLELHSRKTRRKEVLGELERTLRMTTTCSTKAGEKLRGALEAHIRKLNEYASQLRQPYGGLQASPFHLMEMREQALSYFSKRDSDVPAVGSIRQIQWTRDMLDRAVSSLEQLFELRQLLGPGAIEAWNDCNPGQLLPSDTGAIRELLERTREAYEDVRSQAIEITGLMHLDSVSSLNDISHVREALALISSAPELDRKALNSPAWQECTEEQIEQLLELLRDTAETRSTTLERFDKKALEADLAMLQSRLSEERKASFAILKRSYRELISEIRVLYKEPPSLFYRQFMADLERLQVSQSALAALDEQSNTLATLFGKKWTGIATDPERLREISKWGLRYSEGIEAGDWANELATYVGDAEKLSQLSRNVERLEESAALALRLMGDCIQRLGMATDDLSDSDLIEAPFTESIERLERWLRHIPELTMWARYAQARAQPPLPELRPIVSLIERLKIVREDIEPLMNYAVADRALEQALRTRPALSSFVSKLHESKIAKFRKIDVDIVQANRERIHAQLDARKPRLVGGVSPASGMGILLREINKKKRHISIRKLMEQAGDIVQRAKPCFMMSPLSIAQFLDPRTTQFDVIVFDEASQVRPEDALGALLRGNQLVVMGDTRQLPPTSFFDRLVDDAEDEEGSESVGDIESILHLCRRSFPTKQLRWHYRSRHESLIEVSNHEFYDNSLVVYPSPMQSEEGLGLGFRHLPDTIYDRGKSSENRQEARAVARAAIAHFKARPDLSLGVGAFSTKQQNAIQEEVQRELEEQPEMEGYFSRSREEHFFVKNLETIQGDERDVILLSVGYGKDAQGKLSKNFGPVNQDGGERRLNVLITRARHQCVVFSNFRGDDLALDSGAAKGVRALKTFLKYAETRDIDYPQAMLQDTESPFEDSVYEFLRGEGHDIHKQVGSAGYRIDLALCDPERPGRYLLGIECDGAKYHSSQVARERDRLRQQILEKLGWTIHRVWSTDWFVNRRIEQERLLRAVESAKSAPKLKTVVAGKRSSAISTNKPAPRSKPIEYSKQVQEDVQLPSTPYVECERLSIGMDNDIPGTPRYRLAEAVRAVVEVESPVHVDEVTRRIRTLWGLKRTGRRIQEAVAQGIKYAVAEKYVIQRNDFLWYSEEDDVVPRLRLAREMLKIEVICDEEIASAILETLETQYASPKDAIPTITARLLGFQQTSEQIRKAILTVVDRLLKAGELIQKEDGRIDLPSRESGET